MEGERWRGLCICTICGVQSWCSRPTRRFYVPLRSQYGAGGTYRGRDLAEPGACAGHDFAQAVVGGQVAGAEPAVCGVSEVFWRGAEAGERDIEAAGGVGTEMLSCARWTAEGGCLHIGIAGSSGPLRSSRCNHLQ